jgi:hypothetical protein
VIHLGRRPIVQGLMEALLIVEGEVALPAQPGLARARIVVEVHLLVFDAAPEALDEDVVMCPCPCPCPCPSPCPSIHADLQPGVHVQARVLRTGEVTALVAVPDRGGALPQRPTRSGKHEADV